MKLKKKNKMKTVELILYWIILVLFLFANLYYFRGFHKIPFIMACILCLIKTIRYIVVKRWKKWHIINAVVSGFMMYAILQFTCEMDIFLYPTTELRFYKQTLYKQLDIREGNRYGIFPDPIPEEATDVEYYFSTDGYWRARHDLHAYLKMTVSEEYLNDLYKKYEDNINNKLEFSEINANNSHEYILVKHLDEYVEEYYGKENCILYFMEGYYKGFVIDWDKKSVKLFLDYRF